MLVEKKKKKTILRARCDWWLREIRLQWLKRAYWYLIHIHRAQNTSRGSYYLSPHRPCRVGPGILRTNTENKTSFIVLKDVLFPLKRRGVAAENWVSRSPSITWHVGHRHLCCESARLGHRLGLHSPSDCLDCLNPVYLVSAQVDSQRVGVRDELALVYLKTFTWQDSSCSPESHVCLWKWLHATCGSVSSSALKGQRQKFQMKPAHWNVTSEIYLV